MTSKSPRAVEILLYVPNLIGYARVILLCLAYRFMITDYSTTVLLYALSAILDAFDGWAARALNQCSKFGAILDMLTDRVATTSLIMCLGHFYPRHMIWFQLWVMLDISSHWAHQLASVIRGDQSHKSTSGDKKRHFILRLYYTSRPFLFFMCAMNEVFFCSLYLLHFTKGAAVPIIGLGVWELCLYFSAPFMLLKTGISAIHMGDAAWSLACIESEKPKSS